MLTAGSNALANGINDIDTVVGQTASGTVFNAFVLSGQLLSFLPPNPVRGGQIAFGVNDKGVVVGQYGNTGIGTTRALSMRTVRTRNWRP